MSLLKSKVPLNEFAMMNCKCGVCPVQAGSSCAKPKITRVISMRVNMRGNKDTKKLGQEQMEQMKSKPEELPGPYCSIGVSACNDLDNSKACICNQCEVYKKFSLSSARPFEHFCFNGRAA